MEWDNESIYDYLNSFRERKRKRGYFDPEEGYVEYDDYDVYEEEEWNN